MTIEIWKSVVGHEGLYEVSNLGNVRSVPRIDSKGHERGGHLMKLTMRKRDGYVDVALCKDGRRVRVKVHILVLRAFHGECPTRDHQTRHLDDNRANNAATNLAWGTAQENADDKVSHGKTAKGECNGGGGKLTATKIAEIKTRLAAGDVGAHIAKDYGVTRGMIYHIAKERAWSHA